jgi:hypothetical protein
VTAINLPVYKHPCGILALFGLRINCEIGQCSFSRELGDIGHCLPQLCQKLSSPLIHTDNIDQIKRVEQAFSCSGLRQAFRGKHPSPPRRAILRRATRAAKCLDTVSAKPEGSAPLHHRVSRTVSATSALARSPISSDAGGPGSREQPRCMANRAPYIDVC